MKHILTWCEIPVTDMVRAKAFYTETFGFDFVDHMMDGLQMAMFTDDAELISGALVVGEGYEPALTGTIAYLNAGDDLSVALGKAKALGVEVICPKTAIGDGGQGYFAQISDSEGNRVGLYSVK